MRSIYPFIICSIIIASCHGGENKADNSSHEISNDTDVNMPAPKMQDTTSVSSAQPRSIEPNIVGPDDILAKIDEHLTSTVQFKAVPGGGISDGIVTINNTLKDVSFQKALVEVIIRKQDGSMARSDYYTVVNIDAGMSKKIKLPNNSQGSSIITHIVKVKSNELTNGEWVLVGKEFPGK